MVPGTFFEEKSGSACRHQKRPKKVPGTFFAAAAEGGGGGGAEERGNGEKWCLAPFLQKRGEVYAASGVGGGRSEGKGEG